MNTCQTLTLFNEDMKIQAKFCGSKWSINTLYDDSFNGLFLKECLKNKFISIKNK